MSGSQRVEDERRRVAVHEAGHAVVAFALGRDPGPVTIEPGIVLAGSCHVAGLRLPDGVPLPDVGLPLACWPAEWRSRAESDVLVFLAGDAAELMFAPRTGRLPATVAEWAGEIAAERGGRDLPAPTSAEREWAAAVVSDAEGRDDVAQVAHLVWAAHGDWSERAARWLSWLEAETAALLRMHEGRVLRLAAALIDTGTLGKAAAARLLKQR